MAKQLRISVRNMCSESTNREVPNQFIISTPKKKIFQSYGRTICVITKGKVYLDKRYWDYSKTTGKYRNQFLRESISETRMKIKDGIYKLRDLN